MSLEEVEAALGVRLPEQLRDLYADRDGWYEREGEWWVVWPLERVVAENARLRQSSGFQGGLIAFGDDGTGDPFCVGADHVDQVVRWSLIGGEMEGSWSWSSFIAEWLPERQR